MAKLKNIIFVLLFVGLLFARFRPFVDFGFCMDNNGNGIVLNPETYLPVDPVYNYIKYENGLQGKYIYTFCLMNPFTNWNDDIIFRYDYVVK